LLVFRRQIFVIFHSQGGLRQILSMGGISLLERSQVHLITGATVGSLLYIFYCILNKNKPITPAYLPTSVKSTLKFPDSTP
jgi:hypothetical protein